MVWRGERGGVQIIAFSFLVPAFRSMQCNHPITFRDGGPRSAIPHPLAKGAARIGLSWWIRNKVVRLKQRDSRATED